MRKVTLFAMVVATMAALIGAGGYGTSSAAMVLPSFENPTGNTVVKSGVVKLGITGSEITCTENSNFGLLGCKLLGKPCKSLGGTAGLIQLPVEDRTLVLDIVGGVDRHFILEVWKESHIECEALSLLSRIRGTILGLIEKVGAKEFHLTANKNGAEQEFTDYENDAGEALGTGLEASVGTGAFKAATAEFGTELLTTEFETAILN